MSQVVSASSAVGSEPGSCQSNAHFSRSDGLVGPNPSHTISA